MREASSGLCRKRVVTHYLNGTSVEIPPEGIRSFARIYTPSEPVEGVDWCWEGLSEWSLRNVHAVGEDNLVRNYYTNSLHENLSTEMIKVCALCGTVSNIIYAMVLARKYIKAIYIKKLYI